MGIFVPEFDRSKVTKRSRCLPHWEMPGAVYFVTFRLADALPEDVRKAYRVEVESLERGLAAARTEADRFAVERDIVRLYCRRVDACLDVGLGECHLRKPPVATLVSGAFKHFEGERYELFGWVLLPNHAHVLVRPYDGHELEDVMHSWKSYTATMANRLLGRQGTFWQREYFDHIVRSDDDLVRFARYLQRNPAKSGLRDWPWVGGDSRLGF